jgi:hypothetical protein
MGDMKKAILKLTEAAATVLTMVLQVTAAVLRLLLASVLLLTSLVEGQIKKRAASRAATAPAQKKRTIGDCMDRAEAARTPGAMQLRSALKGMGFAAIKVDVFVTNLGARTEREPMPELIKEGLRALAN